MGDENGEDRTAKKATRSRAKGEPSVLGSLPATRTTRIGGRREGPGGTAKPPAGKAPATAKASPSRAAAKRPGAAKPRAGTKAAGTVRTKPATTRPVRARPPVSDRTAAGGPRPVTAGAPRLDAPPEGTDRGPATSKPPSGTELVTTVVQAAGELAHIGVTVGGQILKRAVERLPRP